MVVRRDMDELQVSHDALQTRCWEMQGQLRKQWEVAESSWLESDERLLRLEAFETSFEEEQRRNKAGQWRGEGAR